MKKLILLPFFLFLYCFTSSAQRYADLEITLHAPVTGDIVWVDNPFQIDAYVRNNGPDTIQLQDSIAFELLFDNSVISFGNGGGGFSPYLVLTNRVVAPGDSGRVRFTFAVNQGWDTGMTEICVAVRQLTAVDTLFDTVMNNDRSCANITILEAVSVQEVFETKAAVTVYPNPVKDMLFVSSDDKMERVELFNLQGQELVSKQVNSLNTQIELGGFAPGMYILKVNGSYACRVMKE